jgi:hypothetical protein
MSTIHADLAVAVRCDRIAEALAAYLDDVPKDAEGAPVIALRAPLGDVVFERDAVVRLFPARQSGGSDVVDISWEPKGGGHGRYPSFYGTLSFTPLGAASTLCAIDGAYEPPFGPIGAVVDSIVGRRIARATVEDLLVLLKRELETRARAVGAVS